MKKGHPHVILSGAKNLSPPDHESEPEILRSAQNDRAGPSFHSMRIALVAPLVSVIAQPYLGGAQAMLADLAQGLVARGHRVTLFARRGSFVPNVPIEPIDVPESVRPADFSPSVGADLSRPVSTDLSRPATADLSRPSRLVSADEGFFAQANLFLELFLSLQRRATEFDVIHAHAFDWPAFACGALVHSIPVVHTVHLHAISPPINTALRVLHEQSHSATLVTVSHTCARTYADYTPFDHIVYNGIDIDAIPFSPGPSAGAPLLFAGRISPEKGVEAAIEIAAQAGHRLLIAGSIYDQRYFDQRIAPRLHETGERVMYLGHLERPDLWRVMAQSLGLLFPIQWDEPFGLAAIEALATGAPVIAFRRGAVAEIMRDSETGFLVEPGDISHAAALVADLPAISRTRCRSHIEANFTLSRMIDAYERVYRAVARIMR